MKRRSFLLGITAAAVAPSLPSLGSIPALPPTVEMAYDVAAPGGEMTYVWVRSALGFAISPKRYTFRTVKEALANLAPGGTIYIEPGHEEVIA